MKIVSAAEMRVIDRATSERFGVPALTLMENAGKAVADHILTQYAWIKKTTVVCGKGNNGGDGFVAARHLHARGKSVQVLLLADPADLRGDAAAMYVKLPTKAEIVHTESELSSNSFETDLVVDAILGTGFKPPVTGLYAKAIKLVNASHARVVAVDIPSGADADAMRSQQGTISNADSIVTFTAPRPAHVFCDLTNGPTVVASIGSPDEAIVSTLQLNVTTPRDFAPLVAPRPAESNKGNYGHVLVIGGSLGKAGAAAMAGMSALRAGAGLATIATAQSALPTAAGFYPELMTEPLPETQSGTIAAKAIARISELAKGMSVLAIGPGISRVPETSSMVRELVTLKDARIVLDADGLNAFQEEAAKLSGKGHVFVITPHPGEMARLAGISIPEVQKDRLGVARQFAREHDVIVVLKGHRTLVVQPDGEAWVNTTGNPGMSTGGTGDILTGMVAGLIAQHPQDLMMAACAAVYLHGLAGDVMREKVGEHSLVATDLLHGLPEAFRRARMAASLPFASWNGNSLSLRS